MSEEGIQAFYERLLAELESAGVGVVLLGGQALLRYRIAEATKDADIFVRPPDFAAFIQILARIEFGGSRAQYRVPISAPLAEPWASGGWGAHFEFAGPRAARPRIDVLPSPPRIDHRALPRQGLAPLFLLAETKKTRRGSKDWGQVATLGHFLLDGGDPRGLLLLQDPDELLERLPQFSVSKEMLALRPNLVLALEGSSDLGAALETEQRFWRMLDARRWTLFENAAGEYMKAVRHVRTELEVELLEQHKKLLTLAQRHLPPDPLALHGFDRLVDEARTATLQGYPAAFARYLPPRRALVNVPR